MSPSQPFGAANVHRASRAAPVSAAAALLLGVAMWVLWPTDDRLASCLLGGVFVLCIGACTRALRLHWLSPVMVYFFVFGVFHLGLVLPWGLGLDVGTPPNWLDESSLSQSLFLVALALVSYWLGASLACWKQPQTGSRRYHTSCHNSVLAWCGVAVFVVGCGLFLAGGWAIGFDRLFAASYFEIYKLTNWYDPRFFVTSLTVAPIGLYLIAAGIPRRSLGWLAAAALAWSSLIFLLGFRGFGLIPGITILAVLEKRGVRPPRRLYACGAVILLAAIPAVTVMRDARLSERSLAEAVQSIQPLAAINEMGASLRPLVHTVHYMQTEQLRLGGTYWTGVRALLPNLALDWQSGGYVPLDELPPSHWVTRQAAPWIYRHYGGLGFSAVAEPYMNFGVGGVVGFFALLPAALIAFDRADSSRPTRLAAWAVVIAPLLWTTRNSFGTFFRPALLGLATVAAARFVANSAMDVRGTGRAGGPRKGSSPRWISGGGLRPKGTRRAFTGKTLECEGTANLRRSER